MALFRSRELSIFYQQLGQLYKSGIPPTEGIPMAAAQTSDKGLQSAAHNVHQQVLLGRPLGTAFAANPQVFSDLQIALISVGEEYGRLDQNFFKLAEMYEKDYSNRKKLVFAMLYPAFLFGAALLLPKLYLFVNGSLEAYLTSVLLTALPFFLVFLALYLSYRFFRTVFLKTFDQLQLVIPVLGPNLLKLAMARFGRSLAMLYSGGVELRRSMQLAVRSFDNSYLEDRCRIVGAYLEAGGSLTDGLAAARVFPKEFVQIIALGERTGDLDKVLENTARLYEDEAEKAINTILFFLPIAIYLLVALYIAIIVIQFYSGYYGSLGNIGN